MVAASKSLRGAIFKRFLTTLNAAHGQEWHQKPVHRKVSGDKLTSALQSR